ncbi:hypothetical protein CR513_51330, partial [Mucuna pruriens]
MKNSACTTNNKDTCYKLQGKGNNHVSSILFLNLFVLIISLYNIKEIVDKPKDKRVVGCRWIYIVKCKSDETLDQYKVCILKKALYRLKQSPQAWFERFTQVMISLEYKKVKVIILSL